MAELVFLSVPFHLVILAMHGGRALRNSLHARLQQIVQSAGSLVSFVAIFVTEKEANDSAPLPNYLQSKAAEEKNGGNQNQIMKHSTLPAHAVVCKGRENVDRNFMRLRLVSFSQLKPQRFVSTLSMSCTALTLNG